MHNIKLGINSNGNSKRFLYFLLYFDGSTEVLIAVIIIWISFGDVDAHFTY